MSTTMTTSIPTVRCSGGTPDGRYAHDMPAPLPWPEHGMRRRRRLLQEHGWLFDPLCGWVCPAHQWPSLLVEHSLQ